MPKTILDLIEDVQVSNTFPVESFRELLARPEESAPVFLKVLANPQFVYEEVIDNLEDYPFYAMILLAAMKEQRAFPLLISNLEYPCEEFDEFWGDFLFDVMPQILASTYDGNFQLLQGLARNKSVSDNVRCVAVTTIGVLGVQDQVRSQEVVAEIIDLWKTELTQSEPQGYFQTSLAYVAIDFQIKEMRPWLESEVVHWPLRLIDIAEISELFAKTAEELREHCLEFFGNQPITDPIPMLKKWWDACQPKDFDQEGWVDQNDAQTFVRTEAKVGRNDPCPCNSGKKFKKCCGK